MQCTEHLNLFGLIVEESCVVSPFIAGGGGGVGLFWTAILRNRTLHFGSYFNIEIQLKSNGVLFH